MSLPAGLLANMVELAPDAMLVIDRDGAVTYVNRQLLSLFACSPADILGRGVELLLPERFRDRHLHHRRRFRNNGDVRPMGLGLELYGRRWDGSEFPVEISLSPIEGGMTIAAIRDVTERKVVERELTAAREMADRASLAKSRFLATASHDLRQPLQALSLLNGTLRRMPLPEDVAEAVAQQEEALDAVKRLINALLDISKLESGAIKPQPRDFPVPALLDQLRREFATSAAQKGLRIEVCAAVDFVHCDRALIEQMLRNLVANAIKYTNEGVVQLRSTRNENRVRLEVLDTGIGIPADQLPYIFDEFFQVGVTPQARRDGYGLGLSIVQRIANLLGVKIDVQSQAGQGSAFSIELPAANEADMQQPVASGHAAKQAGVPRQAARLLVVEDDRGVLAATRLLLVAEGFRVVPAASRAEALQRVKEDADIDLVVTDFHLSAGETGLDVIGGLRSFLQRELPAVLVTGDTSSSIRELQADARLRIASKPINADELLALVSELLEQSRPPPRTIATPEHGARGALAG